jgi:hypothetical protein
MFKLRILFAALVIATAFASCKKDDETAPSTSGTTTTTDPQLGKYIGSYGYGNVNNTYYYCLQLKSGGVIEEYDMFDDKVRIGTWSITGTTFYSENHPISNPSVVYVLNGTYNAALKQISGTWGYKNDASPKGLFVIKK